MASSGSTPRENVHYETYGAEASSSGQGGMAEHISRSMKKVQSKDLRSGCLIGKGSSSIVYETTLQGVSYARKDFLRVPSYIFEREAAGLVGLNHSNVLQTYCWTVDEGSCSLVVELMDVDLLNLMQKIKDSRRKQSSGSGSASRAAHLIDLHKFNTDSENTPAGTVSESAAAAPLVYPFDLPEALKIMVQVAEGVKFLHDNGVAHGDLKPINILVTSNGKVSSSSFDENMTFKVSDFGLFWTKIKSRTLVSRRASNLKMARWRAPELLELTGLREDKHESSTDSDWDSDSSDVTIDELAQKFTFEDMARADIYSFALTCSQILTGEDPYPELSLHDLVRGILGGSRPRLPPTCPARLRSLLERCWGEKTKRPSFEDILNELIDLQALLTRTEDIFEGTREPEQPIMIGKASGFGSFLRKMGCMSNVDKKISSISSPMKFYVDELKSRPPDLKALRRFSSSEIKRMTNNFSAEDIIHREGRYTVYRGIQVGIDATVAVLRLQFDFEGAFEAFKTEMEIGSRIYHKCVVALVGYCLKHDPFLIYKYPDNGSLFDHLHGTLAKGRTLNWRMRLHIALTAAQGLEYLHMGCSPSIIHRNVKSRNILLTHEFDAQVVDFELAKLTSESADTVRVMTDVMGTIGYLDPEYYETYRVSTKSDVYSFGVVLLELITGSRSLLTGEKDHHIENWVRKRLQDNDIDSILAPIVRASSPNMESVWKVAEISMRSVEPRSIHRPTMVEVVQELRQALTIEAGSIAS